MILIREADKGLPVYARGYGTDGRGGMAGDCVGRQVPAVVIDNNGLVVRLMLSSGATIWIDPAQLTFRSVHHLVDDIFGGGVVVPFTKERK